MATPINQMGLASLLLGEWEKTKQPLQQRGTILPVGDYQDGRAGLAWPGLLAAPAEGMTNFGRYGYGDEAVADNARSAFDVAGGAVTGGLGVGLAGGLVDDAAKAGAKAYRGPSSDMQTAIDNLRRAVADDEAQRRVLSASPSPQAVPAYGWIGSEGMRKMDADPNYFPSYLTTDLAGAVGEGSPLMADMSQMPRLRSERLESSYDLREPMPDIESGATGIAALSGAERLAAPNGISLDYADILNRLERPTYLNANAPTGSSVPLAVNAMERAGADLPMDLASRMARAREMGFDTDTVWYHGTMSDFPEFSIEPKPGRDIFGIHLGTKDQANDITKATGYAKRNIAEHWPDSRVLPVHVKDGNLLELPDLGKANTWDVGQLRYAMHERGIPVTLADPFNPTHADIRASLQAAGYDGIKYQNQFEGVQSGGPQDSIMLFDPRNIRSVNAAFDPAQSGSANLLAANAPTGSSVPLAVQAAEQSAPKGIRAYHGSPHDFDRFSLDRIGTGEGAQAYGHGLYFAEAEDVAKGYRDNLTPIDYKLGGQPITPQAPTEYTAKRALQLFGPDIDEAITKTRAAVDGGDPADVSEWGPALNQLEQWKQSGQYSYENPGKMYEVNINADPADFLDWDKPLSQQSETVRKAVLPLAEAQAQRYAQEDAYAAAKAQAMGMNLSPAPRQPVDLNAMHGSEIAKMTGLREAGIPGIRYLDGMSRRAGEGSSNYVVFDDSLIDILRKYANAPTGAALPLAMEGQDQDPALIQFLRSRGQF